MLQSALVSVIHTDRGVRGWGRGGGERRKRLDKEKREREKGKGTREGWRKNPCS